MLKPTDQFVASGQSQDPAQPYGDACPDGAGTDLLRVRRNAGSRARGSDGPDGYANAKPLAEPEPVAEPKSKSKSDGESVVEPECVAEPDSLAKSKRFAEPQRVTKPEPKPERHTNLSTHQHLDSCPG